jgi:hypothetical protein
MFALRRVVRFGADSLRVVRRPNCKFNSLSTVSVGCDSGSSAGMGRFWRALAVLAAVTLTGCSVHPIPDDVSPIPTEEIVRSARCEMRLGVFDQIAAQLEAYRVPNVKDVVSDVERYAEKATTVGQDILAKDADFQILVQKLRKEIPPALQVKFSAYATSAIVYDFTFNITEDNNLDASADFKLPFVSPRLFDLGGTASLHKTRVGNRKFKASETFATLLAQRSLCNRNNKEYIPRDENLIYPITGSIGLRKLVKTFVAIADQNGGKDSFVDTLSFTTTISGSVNPTLTLNAVPHSFRLVSASGTILADRTDMHQIIVSLAFPQVKLVDLAVCTACVTDTTAAPASGGTTTPAQGKQKATSNVTVTTPSSAPAPGSKGTKKGTAPTVTVTSATGAAAQGKQGTAVSVSVDKAGAVKSVSALPTSTLGLGSSTVNRAAAMAISGTTEEPYDLNPVWRARYNLCVADAQNREAQFNALRLEPPEVYCADYADAFAARNPAPASRITFSP